MCFEFLDDFQDPIKGGIYGVVHTLFANPDAEDETSETQIISGQLQKSGPVSPVKFKKRNHVLQWMVSVYIMCSKIIAKDNYVVTFRSSMNELGCSNIRLLVN